MSVNIGLKYSLPYRQRAQTLIIIFSVILFLTIPLCLNAQREIKSEGSKLIFEGRMYYGWTLAHRLEMQNFRKHYPAFEVGLLKETYGNTRWEFMYGYPLIGISYWYTGFGGVEALGHAHAVFPYINFPLAGGKPLAFNFRLGVGLGYLTERYHRTENHKNLAIGSHLNGVVNLLFELRWDQGKRWMVSGGLSLVHFSNGTVKTPNYGLNMPSLNLAVAYRFSDRDEYKKQKLLPEIIPFEFDGKKALQLDVSLALTTKDVESVLGQGNRYMVYTVFANIMRPVSYKSKFGIGLDLCYDESDIKVLESRNEIPGPFIKVMKTGLTAAFELSFSKMAMVFNVGAYITGQDRSEGDIYEKLALKYYFNEQLFANFTLKAHLARADFVALGIGYKFKLHYY